jgi:hypothetical protein
MTAQAKPKMTVATDPNRESRGGVSHNVNLYDPNEMDIRNERTNCWCHQWLMRYKRLHGKHYMNHAKIFVERGARTDAQMKEFEARFERTNALTHLPNCPYKGEVIDQVTWTIYRRLCKMICTEENERGIDNEGMPNREKPLVPKTPTPIKAMPAPKPPGEKKRKVESQEVVYSSGEE